MTPPNRNDSESAVENGTDEDSISDRSGPESRVEPLSGYVSIAQQVVSDRLHSVNSRVSQVSTNVLRIGLLLVLASVPVAAQSDFCDSAFGNLLVAVEGLVSSISVSIIVIMVIVGAIVWVGGRIIPGAGTVGAVIIVLAILSFFAMTFGISFLSFAIEIVGYEHCSTLVE